MTDISDSLLDQLRELDTPTICNALDVVVRDRRGVGYTPAPLVCTRPELGSLVGVARTATIRAMHPSDAKGSDARDIQHGYYQYLSLIHI